MKQLTDLTRKKQREYEKSNGVYKLGVLQVGETAVKYIIENNSRDEIADFMKKAYTTGNGSEYLISVFMFNRLHEYLLSHKPEERIKAIIDEDPVGPDDRFYRYPDTETFEAVYFNPDSDAGGQYVIMWLPYKVILDASEQTNDAQTFFESLEAQSSYTELLDVTDANFCVAMENYKNRSADFIGRTNEVMTGLIAAAREHMKQDEPYENND